MCVCVCVCVCVCGRAHMCVVFSVYLSCLVSCPFEGTKEQLSQHLEKCRYEGLKEYLQKTDDHVISLQQDLRRKDEEIEFLRSMLARLSEKLEALDKTTNLRLGEWR